MSRKYKCGFCGKAGHNARTCEIDQARAYAIDEELATMQLTPTKHPAHHELLAEARAAVADKVLAALETVSDRAPAYHLLRSALKLLEECR